MLILSSIPVILTTVLLCNWPIISTSSWVVEAKVAIADEKAIGTERELCETKARASKVEQEF